MRHDRKPWFSWVRPAPEIVTAVALLREARVELLVWLFVVIAVVGLAIGWLLTL